jgi:hypothetical protein
MARDARLALDNHFLGNCETRALHIDAIFWSFVQGNLNVNDYYRKMKASPTPSSTSASTSPTTFLC